MAKKLKTLHNTNKKLTQIKNYCYGWPIPGDKFKSSKNKNLKTVRGLSNKKSFP